MKIAARMDAIAPFHVMEVMARAQALEASGRSIIHLEVGEPDFPTAQPIIDAGREFLSGGHVHYTAALGLPRLRRAIAGWYAMRYGLEIPLERIVVTAGASAALVLAFGALVSPADEWLLPDPGYPCNRHFVRLFEGNPCALPVTAETAYQPTAGLLDRYWRKATRGLLVASPANPTGTLIAIDELERVWEGVAGRGGTLIVDEIYHGLTYGLEAGTALAISDEIVVVNSFSKYFGMTGWRLGWMVIPPQLIRPVEKLAQNLYISPSTIAQHAALAAFQPDTLAILEARRAEFGRRRERLLNDLRRLGFQIAAEPQGAFYIYANCSRHAADSFDLAQNLVDIAGVAVTPGLDFGCQQPESHLRFSYTTDQRLIDEGIVRIERFLNG